LSRQVLKLMPVIGKYVSVSVEGRRYEIFSVDPATNEQGTSIPASDAKMILAMNPTVASLVPEFDSKGNRVSPLSEEEQLSLERALNLSAQRIAPVQQKELGLDLDSLSAETAALADSVNKLNKQNQKLVEESVATQKALDAALEAVKKEKEEKEQLAATLKGEGAKKGAN